MLKEPTKQEEVTAKTPEEEGKILIENQVVLLVIKKTKN
jgi:hypothetical protein